MIRLEMKVRRRANERHNCDGGNDMKDISQKFELMENVDRLAGGFARGRPRDLGGLYLMYAPFMDQNEKEGSGMLRVVLTMPVRSRRNYKPKLALCGAYGIVPHFL